MKNSRIATYAGSNLNHPNEKNGKTTYIQWILFNGGMQRSYAKTS